MAAKKTKKKNKKRIVLLDTHAIIHRGYHALPNFVSQKGEPTGGLFGLVTILISIIKDVDPDYIVACYDLPKPTYRHEVYKEYKAGRKKADPELVSQIKRSRDVFEALSIPTHEKESFEADDVIGTIASQVKTNKDIEVVIASGDMDTLQLVDGNKVKVYTMRKGLKDTVLYNEKKVEERYGFPPKLLADYKGLRGDPSDNIPGVPGVGEKTATNLIGEYKTIEKLIKALKKDPTPRKDIGLTERFVNLILENEEEALFSKELATIRLDVPIKFELPKKTWHETVDLEKVSELFADLEFRTLNIRFRELLGASTEESAPAEEKISQSELKELKIMLWVLDSHFTNPEKKDILHFTKKKNLKDARKVLEERLEKNDLTKIWKEIEKPLIPVVEEMSKNGIQIDANYLHNLSKEYHKDLSKLEKAIWKMAGREFNINSPKQLGEILYDELGLKVQGSGRTAGGARSTREEILQKMSDQNPIIEKILEYRELQKLLSTYIDVLPDLLGKDGRLHAKFLQAGTTTGRFASQDPNIQNIPIKSEVGRAIRGGFVAPKGKELVALDYSQIELRLAAIFSEDKKLLEIFKKNLDVHTAVAAHVFGIPQEKVTKEQRRKAKVINFGILYGMGVLALKKNLKTDRKEAQEFYNNYFETYDGLSDYLDEVRKNAAKNGYTETLFGRRRYFSGINSPLPYVRAQAERMAINAPLQGTQADIIKIAMIKIDKYLQKEGLKDKVKMILQIHDELMFEVDKSVVKEVVPEIKKIMENILTKDQTKGVPIKVNAENGPNWNEMKSFDTK